MPRLAIGWRKDPVVLAPDDQGWNPDTMQPALQLRIVEAVLPGELRDDALVGAAYALVRGVEGARDRVIGELRIEIGLAHRLLLADQRRIATRHAGDVDPGRIHKRQRCQTAWIAHRKLRRGPAAERQADEMNMAEIEFI